MTTRPETRRQTPLSVIFLDHPASVGESYGGHFRFALGFAALLGVAALAAAVHAVVPALCKTTASRIVGRLNTRIATRSAQPASNQ